MFLKEKKQTYIGVTGGAAESWWTVTHKHVESIQTGSAVLTGIRLALVNLCLTPATHNKTVGRLETLNRVQTKDSLLQTSIKGFRVLSCHFNKELNTDGL